MLHILKCYAGNEFVGPEFALVDLHKGLAHQLLEWNRMFLDIAEDNDSLYELVFWDNTPRWTSTEQVEGLLSDRNAEYNESVMEELRTLDDVEIHPNDIDLSTFQCVDNAAVDCVTAHTNHEGIRWMAYPQHCEDKLETTTIPWEAIIEAAGTDRYDAPQAKPSVQIQDPVIKIEVLGRRFTLQSFLRHTRRQNDWDLAENLLRRMEEVLVDSDRRRRTLEQENS